MVRFASYDRAAILCLLQAVEERLSSGERQITNRRDFILSLECAGCDTAREVNLLREMERAQTEYSVQRDRLRAELAVLNAAEAARAQAPLDAATA